MVQVLRYFGNRYVLAGGDEEFVFRTYIHPIGMLLVVGATLAMIGVLGLCFVVALLTQWGWLFVLGVLVYVLLAVFVIRMLHIPNQEIVVTTRNIHWIQWRLLQGSPNSTVIPLTHLTAVQVKQSVVENAFDYGNVILSLAISPGTFVLQWVPRPGQLAAVIREQMTTAQTLEPVSHAAIEQTIAELDRVFEDGYISRREFDIAQYELAQQLT